MKRFKVRIANALVNFNVAATSKMDESFEKYATRYNKALDKYTAEIVKAFKEKKE